MRRRCADGRARRVSRIRRLDTTGQVRVGEWPPRDVVDVHAVHTRCGQGIQLQLRVLGVGREAGIAKAVVHATGLSERSPAVAESRPDGTRSTNQADHEVEPAQNSCPRPLQAPAGTPAPMNTTSRPMPEIGRFRAGCRGVRESDPGPMHMLLRSSSNLNGSCGRVSMWPAHDGDVGRYGPVEG